ncbi:hypothetical protein QOT17_024917 [Balamuthia mandrillaris]
MSMMSHNTNNDDGGGGTNTPCSHSDLLEQLLLRLAEAQDKQAEEEEGEKDLFDDLSLTPTCGERTPFQPQVCRDEGFLPSPALDEESLWAHDPTEPVEGDPTPNPAHAALSLYERGRKQEELRDVLAVVESKNYKLCYSFMEVPWQHPSVVVRVRKEAPLGADFDEIDACRLFERKPDGNRQRSDVCTDYSTEKWRDRTLDWCDFVVNVRPEAGRVSNELLLAFYVRPGIHRDYGTGKRQKHLEYKLSFEVRDPDGLYYGAAQEGILRRALRIESRPSGAAQREKRKHPSQQNEEGTAPCAFEASTTPLPGSNSGKRPKSEATTPTNKPKRKSSKRKEQTKKREQEDYESEFHLIVRKKGEKECRNVWLESNNRTMGNLCRKVAQRLGLAPQAIIKLMHDDRILIETDKDVSVLPAAAEVVVWTV